mmetsp:Transcript_14179/g.30733  ORF Transcript_14179/g.30733 Transcript_14179/m.30733 type:complete len:162 (+) Transcript_14179:55-540(+)
MFPFRSVVWCATSSHFNTARHPGLWRGICHTQVLLADIPDKPREPSPEECCQNGCQICVWDLYNNALREWEAKVAQLDPSRRQLAQTDHTGDPAGGSLSLASRDAFALLEAKLMQEQSGGSGQGADSAENAGDHTAQAVGLGDETDLTGKQQRTQPTGKSH